MFGSRKEAEPRKIESEPVKVEVKGYMAEQISTTLSGDTHFKGSMSFDKSLKIEGTFEGDVTTPGTLYVGKDAKVKAEIKAGSVIIDGMVTGNVTAQDKVELRSTARLAGDIKAAKLVVEDGAAVAGHCEVSLKANEKEAAQARGLVELLGKAPVSAAK